LHIDLSNKEKVLGAISNLEVVERHDPQFWRENRIQLKTIPRRNQQKQLQPATQRLYNSIRTMIETVDAQLSDQLKTLNSIMDTHFRAYALASNGAYVVHLYQPFARQA